MSRPAEIPASEVRAQISEVISRVAYGGERVVISRNGKAQVAVVPIADLDRLQQLDDQREVRRRRAAEAVAEIQSESARTGMSNLTEDDIEAEIAEARQERRRSRKQGSK